MVLLCDFCGKQVSNEFERKNGEQLIIRASVECPECIEKNFQLLEDAENILSKYFKKPPQ